MKAKSTILIALMFAFAATSIAQSLNVESPSSDTLQIPFIERFTTGSLETNNWVADCDNWQILSDSGNPAPCVMFSGIPEISGEYECCLTSDWILLDTTPYNICLNITNKLLFKENSHLDTLFLEVLDSTEWRVISKMYQSVYWEDEWYGLPELTSNRFKIRFRISGTDISNIEYCMIDNIFIIPCLRFPDELEGDYFWDHHFGVKLKWHLPHYGWMWEPNLTWAWDGQCVNVGLSDDGSWAAAAKWDTLKHFSNSYLLNVRAYIGDTDFDSLYLKIWRGENGDILQYSRNVTNEAKEKQWNDFYVTPSIFMPDTSPTYVGFEIIGQDGGKYPMGSSCNEAIQGYGNLFKTNLDEPWDTLSGSNNWCIMLCFKQKPSLYILEGYDIARKTGNDTTYSSYAFVEDEWVHNFEYYDKYPNVDIQEMYSYQVRSTYVNHWVNPKDTALTVPAYAKIHGDEDFVSILVTHYPETNKKDFSLTAYPNPTTTKLIIKSESKLKKVHIYNLLGQKVGELGANNQTQVEIDVSRYQKGIYLLKIETGIGVVSRKFVVE